MGADIISLRFHSEDVLLVDDDRLTQRFTVDALEAAGMSARVAGHLDAARKLIHEKVPSLLLVDGVLPDGSGVELIQEVRSAGYTFPIVFLSAAYRDSETFFALRDSLGVACILHKPISPDHVADRVRWALESAEPMALMSAPAIAG